MRLHINLNVIIISLLLLIGLFFPSSNLYTINEQYSVIMLFLLLLFILILFIKNGIRMRGIKYAYSIIFLTLLFTSFGLLKYNTSQIQTGVFLQMVIFSLVLTINYPKIKATKNIIYLFNLVNTINIPLGLLIMFNDLNVIDFFLKNYSSFYPELIGNMLMNNKPVLYFGSHSIAGFFVYLFFYMNFLLYTKNKSKINLFFALSNIFLLLNIKSVTSLLLFAIAVIQLFYYFKTSKKSLFIALPLIIYIFAKNYSYLDFLINDTFSSTINGFIGRYSGSGVLQQNFEYLENNLLPIGVLNLDNQIYYTDNGFILNFIRGSIFLVVAIYSGLYNLFSNNVKDNKTALWLFILFFAFEWAAFPILYYIRTLYFIPFLIVFVRYVEEVEDYGK